METNPSYASSGGIRTYPDLLDGRNIVYMQLILNVSLVYIYIYVRGWMTVSGCTRAAQVSVL